MSDTAERRPRRTVRVVDLWPVVASARVAPVPATPPADLERYVVPVLGPEGQLITWRLDPAQTFRADRTSAHAVPGRLRTWRSKFEYRADLGPAGLFDEFLALVRDSTLAPRLAALARPVDVAAPHDAADLLDDLRDARDVLMDIDLPAWALRDPDRSRDVLRVAPRHTVLQFHADDVDEDGWQLRACPSHGFELARGDDHDALVGWHAELSDERAPVHTTAASGKARTFTGPIADAFARIAPGSPTVAVRPVQFALAYSRPLVGLREVFQRAVDYDVFAVIAPDIPPEPPTAA